VFRKIKLDQRPGDADRSAILRCSWSKGQPVGASTERAVAALVGAGIGVRSVTAEQSTLEDVFAELTRVGGAEAPEAEP
ncbi:MAG TPA: hypothetical protein VLM85_31460, partial [Polyangiaceae bacterium]|nr:hypothetical protein [Polyangiaceae bacterium]